MLCDSPTPELPRAGRHSSGKPRGPGPWEHAQRPEPAHSSGRAAGGARAVRAGSRAVSLQVAGAPRVASRAVAATNPHAHRGQASWAVCWAAALAVGPASLRAPRNSVTLRPLCRPAYSSFLRQVFPGSSALLSPQGCVWKVTQEPAGPLPPRAAVGRRACPALTAAVLISVL